MSIQSIPAQVHIYCDVCSLECKKDTSYVRGGSIVIDFAGLDYQGSPVGPSGQKLNEVCDSCVLAADEAIHQLIKRKRGEAVSKMTTITKP